MEEYLRRVREDPWALLGEEGDLPPDEWLAAAWEIEAIRRLHSEDMTRTVSKLGELVYTDEYLTALGRALSVERQVELFAWIRDGNPHREDEFRDRFEECFPRCRLLLPPRLTRNEVRDRMRLDEPAARVLLDGEYPLDLPVDLPMWGLARLKISLEELTELLNTRSPAIAESHSVVQDNRLPGGGDRNTWAFCQRSGHRVLIVFDEATGCAEIFGDPPEVGPILQALTIALDHPGLTVYPTPQPVINI
jgi:hypothetical protein